MVNLRLAEQACTNRHFVRDGPSRPTGLTYNVEYYAIIRIGRLLYRLVCCCCWDISLYIWLDREREPGGTADDMNNLRRLV
jgi:hypothetical protein